MRNKKKSKAITVVIIISWLFTLSPYLLFLFIEWYYVLFITSLLFSIRAYNNSTKSNYSTFKAVIITLIFNIFGSLYVHRKMNENPKASFIKAVAKEQAEEEAKRVAQKIADAKRIAEQKAAEVQRQVEEAKAEAERQAQAAKKSAEEAKNNKLTDDKKYWLGVVDRRVNSLPFDFYKSTYTVDSLGEAHFGEYKANEFQVPEDEREEVALARVKGLSSIRDYIQSNGSKEQKFHFDSSIIGALLYASSLGINVDKYEI